MRSVSDRRRRWLLLHASLWLLIGVLATGVWWLSEASQGMGTAFWPGYIMLLLLIPLGLHATLVLATPARRPPAPPAPVPAVEAGERALATVLPKALARHQNHGIPKGIRVEVTVTRERL